MPSVEELARSLDPQAAKLVTIYVRRGEKDQERTIAFRIPERINSLDLLEQGFALDGNQAIFTVGWVYDENVPGSGYYDAPFGKYGETLSSALNTAQRELVRYLREQGFEPKFA